VSAWVVELGVMWIFCFSLFLKFFSKLTLTTCNKKENEDLIHTNYRSELMCNLFAWMLASLEVRGEICYFTHFCAHGSVLRLFVFKSAKMQESLSFP
jgi:hypothetical protein